MHSIRLTHLLLSYVSLCGFFVGAAPTASATTEAPSASSSALSSASANATIEFASAVKIEASVSLELQRLATVPAIPLPTNATQYPQYEAVRQLAPALPLMQQGIKYPETPDLVASLTPSSSNSSSEASPARRQSSMRVLIVGDSITQGQQGDYTWRYRIWQWFQSSGISFQIVGPYKGTKSPPPAVAPQPPPLYGSPADTSFTTDGGYATGVDSGFLSNSNHFAVWGRAAAVDKGLIAGVLQQTPADLMLLMLGFNDLGWFYSDVGGTLASIQTLISNARSVNPSIKIAVANIPHRTHIGGRDNLVQNTDIYNNQLPSLLASMSTAQSPLHVVDIAGTYDCHDWECPGGYDGLHPNAWGEYQIASAFSKTLVNDFNMGSSPLGVPDQNDPSLVRNLPVPSNIRAFSSPQGVTVTWDAVYGAYSYDVQATVNGVTATFSPGTVQSNRWDTQWPLDGWVYTVSVRAVAGDRMSAFTSSVSAVATPELPPPPQNINVQPSGSGVTVTWDPPSGGSTGSIVEYNVIYWDWKWDHCQFISGAAFKSSPAVINDLIPGRNYAVFLVTWNQNGQGLPVGSFSVVPGAGTPPVPSGLDVHTNDPTTVHLTWTGSDSAAGYRVWSRNINTQGSQLQLIGNVTMTSSSCNDQYFLFPGTWNYAFALSAFNGNLESDKGPEVAAPSPPSSVTIGTPGPTCAPEPAWCSDGGSVSVPPVGGGSPTTTAGGTAPTVTGYPVVTNGRCTGRDCVGGKCVGLLCASFSCSGSGCTNGVCTGADCVPVACIGPNCVDGVCQGLGCLRGGCIGSDCEGGDDGGGGSGHCIGFNCISLGCSGLDCVGGICIGPNCSERSCTGSNCYSGTCADTASCTPYGGEQGGGSDAPDDDPETSCTTSNKYPTCTTKFVVVTSIYPDLTSRTTSTGTTSSCYTITACTGSATTVTTTSSTATTIQEYCEPTNCGNVCARNQERGVVPTEIPKIEPPVLEDRLDSSLNLTLSERDIPGPGSGDWGSWYDDLKGRSETITVVNEDGVLGTNTAVAQVMWGNGRQNIVIENLKGCIAVFCVSQIGAFVAHFWERPSITDNFQADVIGILESYLGSRLNPIQLGPEPACYIMAGTSRATNENTAADQETLTRSDPAGWKYQSEVNQIGAKIQELLPGAFVQGFAYVRQVKDEYLAKGYGKGAVLFDPNQVQGPPNGDIVFPPGYATVAVYQEGYEAIQFYWPYQEFQIWRAHPRDGQTANVVVQVDRGSVLDPCAGDVDPPNIESSELVPHGSEITDVGPEVTAGSGGPGQPFQLVDSAGNVVDDNCVFRGGAYAPTADSGSGAVAGVLSCRDTTKQCTRPYFNLATTCGGKAADQCGTLGVDCSRFYQLLATCKY